jgi:phosphate transport system substrate-binding protein
MKRIARTALITTTLLATGLALPCARAELVKVGGTGAGLGIMKKLADAYTARHPDTTIEVLPSLGSSGGIKALAGGAIQVAVSSRDLKDKERTAGLMSRAFGRTPFVFAVAAKTNIEELTLQQLADIYAGNTVAWPDGTKIRIILRPITDADSKMVRSMSPELALAKRQAEARHGMLFAYTDQETQDSLERIPGAFGPTSLGQMLAEHRQLRALTLDGVRPDPQNLANGSYPYAKTLFLVTGPNTSSAAQGFAGFLQSAAAREILAQTGYVPP